MHRRMTSWTIAVGAMMLALALAIRHSSGQQATQSSSGNQQVHAITLPTIDTPLPDAPGRQTVQSTCTICHSTRYITMQPRFSRQAWNDEVQKMVRNYGAPIPQSQMEEIVNYLFAIRGINNQPGAKP